MEGKESMQEEGAALPDRGPIPCMQGSEVRKIVPEEAH